jgi:hypothetical protein
MFLQEHKLLFIHIPKTAGTSVEAFFKQDYDTSETRRRKHLPLSHYERELGRDQLRDYVIFSIVRNPWDRLLSYFDWCKRRGDLEADTSLQAWLEDIFAHRVPTLHDWSIFTDPENALATHHLAIGSQLSMLKWSDGTLGANLIGRFEDLRGTMTDLCRTLGVKEQRLPKKNRLQRRRQYWKTYDNASRGLVADRYYEDIDYFGYSWPS